MSVLCVHSTHKEHISPLLFFNRSGITGEVFIKKFLSLIQDVVSQQSKPWTRHRYNIKAKNLQLIKT